METSELLAFTRAVEAKSLSRAAASSARRERRSEGAWRDSRRGSACACCDATTRALALTDAGDALYPARAIVLDAVEQAERACGRPRRPSADVADRDASDDGPKLQCLVCDFATRLPGGSDPRPTLRRGMWICCAKL